MSDHPSVHWLDYLALHVVSSCLPLCTRVTLACANHTALEVVRESRACDLETPVWDVVAWRRLFPHGEGLRLAPQMKLTKREAAHLHGVKMLDMSGCVNVKGALFRHLRGIQWLNMDGCHITDAALKYIKGIRALSMSSCDFVTDAGLKKLSGVHTLDVSNCEWVTDTTLVHLRHVSRLDVSGCSVSHRGIASLVRVQELRMDFCQRVNDEAFPALAGVRKLSMRGCRQVSDTALTHLAGIEELDVTGCTSITGATLSVLASVRVLRIAGNPHVTDASLAALGDHLQALDVSGCPLITSNAFAPLAHLRAVNITRCPLVKSLSHLRNVTELSASGTLLRRRKLRKFSRLQTLRATHCPHMTDAAIKSLPTLRHLELSECPLVTSAVLRRLRNLRTLSVSRCDRMRREDVIASSDTHDMLPASKSHEIHGSDELFVSAREHDGAPSDSDAPTSCNLLSILPFFRAAY